MENRDVKYFADMEARIPRGKTRTRFAPSPTGYMHVGNLRTALYAYLIARRAGGTFILRIEDTDQNRLVEGAADVIYKTLSDCGLEHDEGPDAGGPAGPYVQTERRDIYARYAQLLISKGGAYRCFCEKDAALAGDAEDTDMFAAHLGGCPCRELTDADTRANLESGKPYVIRQRIPDEGETTFTDMIFGDITVPNATLTDGVLIKSDGLPTYNFANVVDDHLMGITHVVRGTEYLSSAPKYNLLYESFGWEIPSYVHCSPVMRDANNKMSKRHGDPSFEDLKGDGYLTEAIVNYVALLGWSPGGEREIFTLNELAEIFDVAGISKSPAIFDAAKLTHFNAEYIRALEPEVFFSLAEPYIREAVKNPDSDTRLIAPLIQPRCEKLTDIPGKLGFFDALPDYDTELYVNKKSKTNEENSLSSLVAAKDALKALADFSEDAIKDAFTSLAEERGVKNAVIMWPVRIAVAGQAVTPGGAVELCRILGRDETLRRIEIGIDKLTGRDV